MMQVNVVSLHISRCGVRSGFKELIQVFGLLWWSDARSSAFSSFLLSIQGWGTTSSANVIGTFAPLLHLHNS